PRDRAVLLPLAAHEGFEDPLALLFRNSRPEIADGEARDSVGALERDLDLAAGRRVLPRIVEQVHERLRQRAAVAARLARDIEAARRDREAVARGERRDALEDLARQLVHSPGFQVERPLAPLEAAEVEDVLDQGGEAF